LYPVDRLFILVAVRRFHDMGDDGSRSLRFDNYVRMQHFVRRSTYIPFRRFWGMCGDNSCNSFRLLFMVLWVLICMRAVLMLRHSFMFLGLRFLPPFFFLLGGVHCLFYKNLAY
jgi:hypothetical protein